MSISQCTITCSKRLRLAELSLRPRLPSLARPPALEVQSPSDALNSVPYSTLEQWPIDIRCLRSLEVSESDKEHPEQSDVPMSIGGSFGVVYKAIEIATGEVVAIKHVRRSISSNARFTTEI